jgi:hypothetical protein
LVERARAVGGEGTPAVSEFAAAEFGALQGVGMVTAWNLIAAALDLRHRLPKLWTLVQAGHVRAWQARKVAEATRHLPWDACADLDHHLAGYLNQVPWPRFAKILAAAIIEADPALAAERELQARTEREVYATQSEHGLKLLIARAAAGDVAVFMATVNRIADILALQCDTDLVGVRRSKAIGILAQPALALQLLIDHQHDATDLVEPGPNDGPEHTSLDLTPPARFDAAAARPRVVLHYHLSDTAIRDGHGTVRPDDGVGDPISLNQLREWLTDAGCPVTVRPVWDPADVAPIDGYEITQRMREAVRMRRFADMFPYGTCTSATMDLDHTLAYVPPDRGGPPGQTRLDNLGPLARASHRAATHGRWQKRQPDPGTYVWRSPNGWIYLVTNHGTLSLGRTPYAHATWQAAAPTRAAIHAVGQRELAGV